MPATGATRYQKFLKSERAKTKLKRNKDKELPRGTNVTKTNFKVKKIALREQLKSHERNEAVTRKKLNLQELLSRLNHFNVNARTEGLDGLKELVSTRPDVLELNLGRLLHAVTPLLINVEKKVRRESLKVLHLILSNASAEKVTPFFDVMCTYLRCAMTHIDIRIQEDSLLFLDVLLLCTPEKVAKDFYKIIPNFIDMISKLRVDSKPGRTLTVNLGSQITSAKWRVKVLHRLQELLDQFVKLNKSVNTIGNVASVTRYFNDTKLNYHPLFNSSNIANSHLSCFSIKNSNSDTDVSEDEAENFKKYLDTLIPLLYDTWLEVCPNINKNTDKNMETMISEEAATLLKHLLEVIFLLWEYVQILNKNNPTSDIAKWFRGKFRTAYGQHIMSAFPYHTHIRTTRDKNTSEVFVQTITDPKLLQENLKICHLFVHLNFNLNLKTQGSEMGLVLNYIDKAFSRNKDEGNNGAIIKVLNSLFSTESWGWAKHQNLMDTLFDKIVSAYFNKELSSAFHQDIFALLCRISLDEQLGQLHKTNAHEKWIKHLPDILCCESISTETIDILHRFAVQNNKIFNQLIKPKLLSILKNLPAIKINQTINAKESDRKLLSLLYWIEGWDNESLNFLEKQMIDNAYGGAKTKFILDTLKIKSEGIFQ